MRGLKYLLLSAWTTIVTSLPAEGGGVTYSPQPLRLKFYDGEVNEILQKRLHNDTVTPVDYCRLWAHSSTLMDEQLYIGGGLVTFKEDYREGWEYFYKSALAIDFSTGIQFPVMGNSPVVTGFLMDESLSMATQQDAFWWDGGDYIYKYGGWYADNNIWNFTPTVVTPSHMLRFNLQSYTWEFQSVDPPTIHRAWGGAVASVPEKKLGYFLGGIVENRTDTAFTDAPGYLVLQDSFLHFDSGSRSFVNYTAPELGHIALGSLVHIPDMGNDGILVYLGGAIGPSGWVPVHTTNGMSLRDLGMVWVYDIKNRQWYSQKATGEAPVGRISACMVVIPSQDKTSWNVFLHGGGSLGTNSGKVYGDTWVLSLPSFQWVLVDETGDPKFEHTCHVIKGNQMLVVGGRDKLQEFERNPDGNYTWDPNRWSCLKQGVLSSMNLNTFEWETGVPADDASYEVSSRITDLIGGNATGGANKVAPLNGWEDPGLGTIMSVPVVSPKEDSKSHTASPTQTTGKVGPTNSTSQTDSGGGAPIGAIVGGVVGVIAIISITFLIGLSLLRRRHSLKDPGTNTGPIPPVAVVTQPLPGYVWDPHMQQYYPLGSSPPQPPGGFGYDGNLQEMQGGTNLQEMQGGRYPDGSVHNPQ